MLDQINYHTGHKNFLQAKLRKRSSNYKSIVNIGAKLNKGLVEIQRIVSVPLGMGFSSWGRNFGSLEEKPS